MRRILIVLIIILASAASYSQSRQSAPDSEKEARLSWFRDAKYGLFIHWGLYSVLGRHEWAMEKEGIPVLEYEQLAKQFTPKPNAARAWAKLAKQAGQKYMVMTTKHHEGFCLFDTKLTNYCAAVTYFIWCLSTNTSTRKRSAIY